MLVEISHIPSQEPLRREWVKFQLRAQGSSLSKIAKATGLSRHTIGDALRRPYPRVERAIAAVLGVEPKLIWPDRYDPKGHSNRPLGRPKKSTNKLDDAHNLNSSNQSSTGSRRQRRAA